MGVVREKVKRRPKQKLNQNQKGKPLAAVMEMSIPVKPAMTGILIMGMGVPQLVSVKIPVKAREEFVSPAGLKL